MSGEQLSTAAEYVCLLQTDAIVGSPAFLSVGGPRRVREYELLTDKDVFVNPSELIVRLR